MLDSMRRGASGLFAKLLLGLLIVSFAIWGIADMFRGGGQEPMAKVGSTTISEEEYRTAVQRQMAEMSRQFSGAKGFTIDTARQLAKLQGQDFDRVVLDGLMDSAAVDHHVRQLGLTITDSALTEQFKGDPRFVGMGGSFSYETFQQYLLQSGFRNEREYLTQRKAQELRSHIFGALTHGVLAPLTTVQAVHRYRNDGRVVEYIALDPAKMPKAPVPTDAQVKESYERYKTQHVAPELRDVSVLILSGDALKKRIEVSEADVQKAFGERKESFETPEKRRILQASFRERAGAEKLLAEIKGGKSFEDAAKAAGYSATDLDLGVQTRKELIDAKVAEAAFALKKDVVSDVVAGQLSFALLKVTEIVAGKTVTFDEVKERIRDDIAVERARPMIPKIHEQVDDMRGSRQPLAKIAEKLGLIYEAIPAIDKNGRAPDGKQAFKNAEVAVIVRQIFDTAVGAERDPLELPGGGFIWGDVHKITPSRQRTLDDVKADISKQLQATEQDRLIRIEADKLVARVKKGPETLADIAKALGLKLETTETFTRSGGAGNVPKAVVDVAFSMPKGAVDSVRSDDLATRLLVRMKDVVPAVSPTPAQLTQLRELLTKQMGSDLENEYLIALRERVGSRVNETIYRRAIGAIEATQ